MQNIEKRIDDLEYKTKLKLNGTMVFKKISLPSKIENIGEGNKLIEENNIREFYIDGKLIPEDQLKAAKIIIDDIGYELNK